MTPVQFASNVQRIYNRLKDTSVSLELKDRQIIYWLDTKRALRIERTQANKMLLNDWLFQDIGCVPLCRVDKAECDSITYGCNSLKVDIDKLISLPDMASLRVNMVDKISRIYYTSPNLLKARLDSVMGRNFNWCTIIGNQLYIIPNPNMWENFAVVNIQGIFESPTTVTKYDQCVTKCGFDIYNDDYPAPAGMLDEITLDILTKELNIAMRMIADDTNDNRDNK